MVFLPKASLARWFLGSCWFLVLCIWLVLVLAVPNRQAIANKWRVWHVYGAFSQSARRLWRVWRVYGVFVYLIHISRPAQLRPPSQKRLWHKARLNLLMRSYWAILIFAGTLYS